MPKASDTPKKKQQVQVMQAIVTGSFAYGTPTKKSDVDIVILCDLELDKILNDELRPDSYFHMSHPSVDNSIRQGRINLIIETRQSDFDVWVDGTNKLMAKKPVTRDEAVKLFSELRGLNRIKTKVAKKKG